jgi:hypothetical protein
MKFVVIVTPKGTYSGETVSFESFCVKIARPVRLVDDLKMLQKESCSFAILGTRNY